MKFSKLLSPPLVCPVPSRPVPSQRAAQCSISSGQLSALILILILLIILLLLLLLLLLLMIKQTMNDNDLHDTTTTTTTTTTTATATTTTTTTTATTNNDNNHNKHNNDNNNLHLEHLAQTPPCSFEPLKGFLELATSNDSRLRGLRFERSSFELMRGNHIARSSESDSTVLQHSGSREPMTIAEHIYIYIYIYT